MRVCEQVCSFSGFSLMEQLLPKVISINTLCWIVCIIKIRNRNKAETKVNMSINASGSKSIQFADDNADLFLEQLDIGISGTIVVMICSIWDVIARTGRYLSIDFVVSDAKVS